MNIVFGVIIGLLILMLLVIAHEFGHFVMARKNGVVVDEFGIGFPPRAIAWKRVEVTDKNGNKRKKWQRLPRSEWEKKQDTLILSLNFLPIGGFCSMRGETDSDRAKGSFGAATFWGKTKILFGGVLFNWLVAFIILTILSFVGMPHFMENQFYLGDDISITTKPVLIQKVEDDSPAAKAGLVADDQIVSVSTDGKTFTDVYNPSDVISFNNAHADETVTYTIAPKDGPAHLESVEDNDCFANDNTNIDAADLCHVTVKLNPSSESFLLGVHMSSTGKTLYRSTWSAPLVGAVTTVQLTGETFRGLGTMLWQFVSGAARQVSPDDATRQSGREDIAKAGDSVSGPVGIIGTIFPAFTSTGPINVAFLAALISVSLACMNVLPIPALDGGRWLLIAIYRIRRKPLTKETEAKIVSRAFIVLLALIILITVLDITKLFR